MSIMNYWVCIEAVQWSAGAARRDSGPIAIGAFSGFGVPATGRTAALPSRPGVEIAPFSCIMRGFKGIRAFSVPASDNLSRSPIRSCRLLQAGSPMDAAIATNF
jgi:hypothetical protein